MPEYRKTRQVREARKEGKRTRESQEQSGDCVTEMIREKGIMTS